MRPTITQIAVASAREFGIGYTELVGDARRSTQCRARWAAMLVSYEHGYSSGRIGHRVNRDHTTVLHGIDRARVLVDTDPDFRDAVTAIKGNFPLPKPQQPY